VAMYKRASVEWRESDAMCGVFIVFSKGRKSNPIGRVMHFIGSATGVSKNYKKGRKC